MARSIDLLRQGRAPEPEPCRGSGEVLHTDKLGRQLVACPTCERRFNVAAKRTAQGVLLPEPYVVVPRHRAPEEN